MKIKNISISNYRSIINVEEVRFSNLQSLIGENNAGKSNILSAIECFLSSGVHASIEDFNDIDNPIIIKINFFELSEKSKKDWRPYLINNDELILEKHIFKTGVTNTGKTSLKSEYHGYKAEPTNWFLSFEKIEAEKGNRPNWLNIVQENNLPSYFIENDKCNKTLFRSSLARYLSENSVIYDEPDLSDTQALGFNSVAVSKLPKFYLLKAVSDYSNEIDKRSSNTTFRKLMGDLAERILKKDGKYAEITAALNTIENLLNEETKGDVPVERLSALDVIERKIKELLSNLMPSVQKVKLKVLTEDVKSIFSKGVELSVDDGVETDVLLKGHGLQRCIIFSLLQTLIYNERNKLMEGEVENEFPLILAIEEPELYIHPQIRKLFYDVLIDFSQSDQVIYCTHSTQFVDIYKYDSIAIVKKNISEGTKVYNCNLASFDGIAESERKMYKMFQKFNNEVNELFFAKNVVLVEGIQDKIAITETLIKQNKIRNRVEELDFSIIIANGKDNIPAISRVLNSFSVNYVALFDLDIKPDASADSQVSQQKSTDKIKEVVNDENIVTFPINLEATSGVADKHFNDTFQAYSFFSNHGNINAEMEEIVNRILYKLNP